jgi:hypothetical protein
VSVDLELGVLSFASGVEATGENAAVGTVLRVAFPDDDEVARG